MQHYVLIGDPVAHSLSPMIYNTWFSHYGIEAEFSTLTVKRNELSRSLLADLSGFACTMPHKQSVRLLLDELAPSALAAGSVNIVTAENGRLTGWSTDGEGLLLALSGSGHNPKSAVLLGSGGAARSALYALLQSGCHVTVCARNESALAGLSATFGVSVCTDIASAPLETADTLINATPQGMSGFAEFSSLDFLFRLPPSALVCDMVYNPQKTALLEAGKARGLAAMGGLKMLLGQAQLAFRLWTGITPDPTLLPLLD